MPGRAALFAVLAISAACPGLAATAVAKKQSPMAKVVTLIIELKAKVEADGMSEQKSYDKYACWCEKTLERKAKDIADAKAKLIELQEEINKLSGDLGTHGAEIGQLKKDIAENLEAQREATELREKENAEYEEEKTEAEQCIGALETAVGVLTGAGTKKKGFLQTLQEAQVVSAAVGLKELMNQPKVAQVVSAQDLDTLRHFIQNPQVYADTPAASLLQSKDKKPNEASLLQNKAEEIQSIGVEAPASSQIQSLYEASLLQNKRQNPFGDYAPQSTVIQGILKGMYDAFTESLEKANAEEADAQKAYEELMATKKEELATLEAALAKEMGDDAAKEKRIADARAERDDTEAQLKADEKFFEETKAGCKLKANEWANRCRLRTMELQGLAKGIEILNSPEARRTFTAARNTLLLQVSAGSAMTEATAARNSAFERLRALASKYHDLNLAQIAVAVKTGGPFDKVIAMIDEMIVLLRKEGMDDQSHKDRCQTGEEKNSNDKEDFAHDIDKAEKEKEVLTDEADKTQRDLYAVESAIEETKKEMEERLELRNAEAAAFKQALKEDTDAVAIIGQAIEALTKFYSANKIPLELMQKKEPEYTIDEDKAPETTWEGGDYGGTTGESGGIIAILEMLKEDFEKEIKVGREEDAAAQQKYLEDKKAMQETLDAQMETKVTLAKTLADLKSKIAATEAFIEGKEADLEAAKKMSEALAKDCAWVETHFESRKEKREREIAGLMEAKTILGGAEEGAVFGGIDLGSDSD